MISKSNAGNMPMDSRKSAPQNTSVGSGSRPSTGKEPIATSAPKEPHTLGRAPEGWLK